MSIRLIAVELYKAQKEVHRLRDLLEKTTGLEAERLRRELQIAEVNCNQLRRRVEARKELGK
ncbi:hypothetical protein [Desulfogranum japonicum]|uniref:hypothetical protein n=1 Tax=Desulfogranum japonicum TaxID=231447 RepID=UPI0004004011|nr:hypothetical protein [Desulfogranum japonicum]